jgi:hypothetical protein
LGRWATTGAAAVGDRRGVLADKQIDEVVAVGVAGPEVRAVVQGDHDLDHAADVAGLGALHQAWRPDIEGRKVGVGVTREAQDDGRPLATGLHAARTGEFQPREVRRLGDANLQTGLGRRLGGGSLARGGLLG